MSESTQTKAIKAAVKPAKPEPTPRAPLDPIVVPLWRLKRPARRAILEPFVGHWVRLDRWYGRVAAKGDIQYTGEVLAVAESTTGSTADFLIIKLTDGTVLAVSDAQVYYLAFDEKAPAVKKTPARVAAAAAAAPAKRTRARVKAETVA